MLLAASGPALASPAGDVEHMEAHLAEREDVFFFGGFEASPWEQTFGVRWQNMEHGEVGADYGKQGAGLRVQYPEASYSGNHNARFRSSFSEFDPEQAGREEIHFRYYVRFSEDFDFGRGGKLPGLGGGEANTGGTIPDGTDGWSVRLMWREDGDLHFYVYLPTNEGDHGTYHAWESEVTPGEWESIEMRVKLNTPGESDGLMEGWHNGRQVISVTDQRYRDVDGLEADTIIFDTFFGGGDASWGPDHHVHADFDNLVLADEYIGVIPEPSSSALFLLLSFLMLFGLRIAS